ncbi:MAG: DUF58 domain-containing protein [Verrucomicrobiota bacterium]
MPAAEPTRSRFRLPRRLRVTAVGKAFLLITFGVGIAAINTGNNLLYLALCMNLSLIVVSGVLSERTLRGVSLSVFPASEAFAGSEAFLAVTCSVPARRFPGFSLSARLRIGSETVPVRFPDIAPGGSASRVVRFRPSRRGYAAAAAAELSTLFPFSLFEKSLDRAVPADLLVYPRPLPPVPRDPGALSPAPAESPWHAGRWGPFPRGARELQPADPVRDIHWKASARVGRWMVKERESESAPAVDLRVPLSGPEERFEASLSGACGAVIDLDRRNIPYCLWIGDRACCDPRDPGRRARALAALATASYETAAPPGAAAAT